MIINCNNHYLSFLISYYLLKSGLAFFYLLRTPSKGLDYLTFPPCLKCLKFINAISKLIDLKPNILDYWILFFTKHKNKEDEAR